MRLLLVHGRAQEGKSSASIEAEWLRPLRRGIVAAGLTEPSWSRKDVPFYGNDLKALVDSYDLPPGDEIETRGGAVEDEYSRFLAEVAIEARDTNKASEADIERELGPGPETRGPENWKWVQAVIRAIDRGTPNVSNNAVGVLLRDVFIYVNFGTVQRKINQIVAEAVTDERTVAVGHSLGSVVAYEVFRERGATNIARYVTVGSPLGIRAIRRRLQSPLTMPVGVADWFNARDARDVVALYPLDGGNFDINPSVRNYSDVTNHTDNRHGIDGYLDNADVAKAICDAV